MQPLAGIRVLDFSTLLPGPLATLLLAEAGAEVIKIERPGAGDEMRSYVPKFGTDSVNFAVAFCSIETVRVTTGAVQVSVARASSCETSQPDDAFMTRATPPTTPTMMNESSAGSYAMPRTSGHAPLSPRTVPPATIPGHRYVAAPATDCPAPAGQRLDSGATARHE